MTIPFDQVIDLTDHALASDPGTDPSSTAPLIGFHVGRDHPLAESPRRVEGSVFDEFFGTPRRELDNSFRRYEDASEFVCVMDARNMHMLGAARVILPNEHGFKSLNDIETVWGRPPGELASPGLERLSMHRTWDMATLAVVPGVRKGLVSATLYNLVCTASARAHVEWFVSVLDSKFYRLLQWRLKRMFSTYTDLEPQMYDGSVSIPVVCHVPRYRRRLQQIAPLLDRSLFHTPELRPSSELADVFIDLHSDIIDLDEPDAGVRRGRGEHPGNRMARR